MRFDSAFFSRDPACVARGLIGAVLEVIGPDGRRCAGRLVEVEAYGGADDPASHAGRGPTPRSAIMFGSPGLAYVYFIYGMHHCLNIVTGATGIAGAVLLRSIEPVSGRRAMAARRGLDPAHCVDRDLGAGPGRLCRALGIDLAWNGCPVAADLRRGPLARGSQGPEPQTTGRLRLLPAACPAREVIASPRIGVRRAADRPWRFCDPDSRCLSRPPS